MWSRRKSDVRKPKLDVRMPKPDVHRHKSVGRRHRPESTHAACAKWPFCPFYSYSYIRRAGANSARICNEGDVARLVFTECQAYGLAQVDALSRVDEQASIGLSLENLYRIVVSAGHK